MKKLVIVASLLALALSAAACGKEELKTPVPKGPPLFGYTKAGVFFVHDTLVKNVGEGELVLRSQVSEYRPRTMEKKGDYFVYDAAGNSTDMERLRIYAGFPISYYFELPDKASVPGSLMEDHADLFNAEFIRFTAGIGYVFYTEPVDNPLK